MCIEVELIEPPPEIFKKLHNLKSIKIVELIGKEKKTINALHQTLIHISPLFNSIISTSSSAQSIDCSKYDIETIENGLLLYHGEKLSLNREQIHQLIDFAIDFQLESLLDSLKDRVSNKTNIENCSTNLLIAKQLNMESELIEIVEPFFLENYSPISQTQSFLELTSEIIMKHIEKPNLIVKSELDVFISILNWLKHDYRNRKEKMKDLLQLVRYDHFKGEELAIFWYNFDDGDTKMKESDLLLKVMNSASLSLFVKNEKCFPFVPSLNRKNRIASAESNISFDSNYKSIRLSISNDKKAVTYNNYDGNDYQSIFSSQEASNYRCKLVDVKSKNISVGFATRNDFENNSKNIKSDRGHFINTENGSLSIEGKTQSLLNGPIKEGDEIEWRHDVTKRTLSLRQNDIWYYNIVINLDSNLKFYSAIKLTESGQSVQLL